jgi:hypothetical protein
MEFHLELTGASPDVGAITQAVLALDPAALVDIDSAQSVLRVAAAVDAGELAALIEATGYPLQQHQLIQIPSTCCGGCSG